MPCMGALAVAVAGLWGLSDVAAFVMYLSYGLAWKLEIGSVSPSVWQPVWACFLCKIIEVSATMSNAGGGARQRGVRAQRDAAVPRAHPGGGRAAGGGAGLPAGEQGGAFAELACTWALSWHARLAVTFFFHNKTLAHSTTAYQITGRACTLRGGMLLVVAGAAEGPGGDAGADRTAAAGAAGARRRGRGRLQAGRPWLCVP